MNEIAELEKTLNRQRKDNKALNTVSLEELETRYQNDDVLLLDVRPDIEYQFGHITGAISMPMNELMARLNDLSKDKEVIAYCRGPFCILADKAVKILHEKGFKVRRLDEGYPEWKIKHLHNNNSYK